MFHSHCLRSRKGPLGAIWVAAYCLKKLKKSQVMETDVSSSVDQILQDELNAVTYRVMAYLLLGIARIYSKKVEYLYLDCNQVLTEINEFVVSTKDSTRKGTLQKPYYAITIPKRFELDAFDLGILEDVTGSNMVSNEEITLKDNIWENDILLSLDENYGEEITAVHSLCYSDDTLFKDVFSPHLKDIEMQASTLQYHIMPEKFQVSTFSHEKYEANVSTRIEDAHLKQIKLFDEDCQSHEEEILEEKMWQLENVVPEASTQTFSTDRLSYEENVILKSVSRIEKETSEHAKPSDEDYHCEGTYGELVQSENELEFMNEGHNFSNSERSMEKLRDNTMTIVDSMDIDMPGGAEDEPTKLIGMDSEGHDLELLEMKSPEKGDRNDVRNNLQLSISLDGISDSKFPDFTGTKTPEFMTIPTPAKKERPRTSRKRRCIVDHSIVLSNEKLKQSICDARDLVSKRRKCPHSALAAWKASRISNLSFGFSVPLMSCVSSELRFLLSETIVNTSKSAEMGISPQNLDAPSSPTLSTLVKTDFDSPITTFKTGEYSNAPDISGSITTNISEQITTSIDKVSEVSVPERLSTPEPQTLDRFEQIAIAPGTPTPEPQTLDRFEQIAMAPGTPIRCSTSARSFGSPESPKVPTSNAIRFCEGDERESGGWSGKTRMVAGYLLQNFTNQRVQSVDEVVNLSHILSERTRKESANVFYEILVLKTKDCVDVKQEYAYGDILVWKLPNWGTAFGTGLSITCDDSV